MKIRLSELRSLIREAARESSLDKLFQELETMSKTVDSNVSQTTLVDALTLLLKVKDSNVSGDRLSARVGLDAGEIPEFVDVYKGFTRRKILLGDELLAAVKLKIDRAQRSDDPETVVDDAKLMMKSLVKMSAALSKFDDVEEEAPEGSPLGKFAFPLRRRGVPPEPDTPEEKRLFNALVAHFVDNIKLNAKAAMGIKDLLSQGLYPEVFSPPDQEEVFRGMSVSKAWLSKTLGMAAKDIPAKGSKEVETTYTPRNGGGSSWTVNKAITSKYFRDPSRVGVVLHARTADNPGSFVMGPDHLYRLDFIAGFAYEKEVVGLGDIKIYKISWIDET